MLTAEQVLKEIEDLPPVEKEKLILLLDEKETRE